MRIIKEINYNMANKKSYSQKDKEKFATFMRGYAKEGVLRRIADAFDRANNYVIHGATISSAISMALAEQGLPSYSIIDRPLIFSQAEIIHEMVRENKYGGLSGVVKNIPVPIPPRSGFSEPREFLAEGSQPVEEYLAEYERGLMEP